LNDVMIELGGCIVKVMQAVDDENGRQSAHGFERGSYHRRSVKRAISARRHLIPNGTLPNCIVFEMFCIRFAAMRIVACDGAGQTWCY